MEADEEPEAAEGSVGACGLPGSPCSGSVSPIPEGAAVSAGPRLADAPFQPSVLTRAFHADASPSVSARHLPPARPPLCPGAPLRGDTAMVDEGLPSWLCFASVPGKDPVPK